MGKIFFLPLAFLTCNVILQCTPGWWNGRHKGLKIPRFIRAGSSPAPGTTFCFRQEYKRSSGLTLRVYYLVRELALNRFLFCRGLMQEQCRKKRSDCHNRSGEKK